MWRMLIKFKKFYSNYWYIWYHDILRKLFVFWFQRSYVTKHSVCTLHVPLALKKDDLYWTDRIAKVLLWEAEVRKNFNHCWYDCNKVALNGRLLILSRLLHFCSLTRRRIHALKGKMESFWPKNLSHWWN